MWAAHAACMVQAQAGRPHTSSDTANHVDCDSRTGLHWLTGKVKESAMICEKGWLAPVALQQGQAAHKCSTCLLSTSCRPGTPCPVLR